jgi:uncharacterized membrane protein YeiH
LFESHAVLFTVVYLLDVFGTAVFAVTGAFKAIEHKYDIVGIVIVATVTGTAGAIMRDLLFGIHFPAALSNPVYIVVTTIVAICVFLLYRKLRSQRKLFIIFDAVGLGVFTLIGAYTVNAHFGENPLLIIIGGVITAIGGGILRDVLVNEHPIVFTKEIYAAASFLGVIAFYVLEVSQVSLEISVTATIVIVIAVRLLAVKRNWNLPRVAPI